MTPERQLQSDSKPILKPDLPIYPAVNASISFLKKPEICDADNLSPESDEEMSCYEDDFSLGIDLPLAVETSGNVTPIPTTGELEELRFVWPFIDLKRTGSKIKTQQ